MQGGRQCVYNGTSVMGVMAAKRGPRHIVNRETPRKMRIFRQYDARALKQLNVSGRGRAGVLACVDTSELES